MHRCSTARAELTLQQRRRPSRIEIFRPGAPQARSSAERVDVLVGDCDLLRLYLPRLVDVCTGQSTSQRQRRALTARSAFNAIISSAVIALDLSYAIPIAVNCLRGRRMLPERRWRLPMAVGWVADIVCRWVCIIVPLLMIAGRTVLYHADNRPVCLPAGAAGLGEQHELSTLAHEAAAY